MQYPDRLRIIDIAGKGMDEIFTAMNRAFPALEMLRVDAERTNAFLQVSDAPNLRVLSLRGVYLSPLSRLLLSATNLVDLELCHLKQTDYLSPATLLLHLQFMPCLRRVKLGFRDITYHSTPRNFIQRPISSKNAIALSKLVSFQYRGDTAYLEGLVSRLAPPPLEDIRIELLYGSSFAIPGLVRFIRAALAGTSSAVVAAFFGEDSSHFLIGERSDDDSDPIDQWTPFGFNVSFRDVDERVDFMARIWGALAETIAPVEELDLACHSASIRSYRVSENRIPWRTLLEHFFNVKKLDLDFNSALELAHFLCAGDGEPASDVLPALEEIELYTQDWYKVVPIDLVDAFQPFVATRNLATRTVKVYIMTDEWLATHMRHAKTCERFEKVDKDYVLNAARAAKTSDASQRQRLAATEQGLVDFGYADTIIFRPGFLRNTNRLVFRPVESVAGSVGVTNRPIFTGLSLFTDKLQIDVDHLGESMRIAEERGTADLPPSAGATKTNWGSCNFTVIANRSARVLAQQDM
ncbi:hypothetical protein BJV78DRAFT_1286280 [Lactifluus subvellereus]|nr:hypothetical protein BJV78DRAFT_1286280 [Lactifluus subvellereus]